MVEGGNSLGYTAGSVKVQPTQINAFFWAWTAGSTNSAGVSKLLTDSELHGPSMLALLKIGVAGDY